MKKILVSLLITVSFFGVSNAQTFESKVDSMLSHTFKDKNGPGGVLMVAKGGKSI